MTFSQSYAHDGHYIWIEDRLKLKCSPLGKDVANILGYVADGIYNAPIKPEKPSWENEYYIFVSWQGGLTNWDRFDLTKLFVCCARKQIRVTIEPASPSHLRLCFWKRDSREGTVSHCLPDIEELVKFVDDDFLGFRQRRQQ